MPTRVCRICQGRCYRESRVCTQCDPAGLGRLSTIDADDLSDREFDILCYLADQRRGMRSINEVAEVIEPDCPGPRTAVGFASDCCWRLVSLGLIDQECRHEMPAYAITRLGRKWLDSPARC